MAHIQPFQGFLSPNSTPVPDELFDELMSLLSGAELKVLLYIIRRTFGFKKRADNISLQQICHGIITRDGEILDRGTGLSLSTVQGALKGLVEKQCVVTVRNKSKEKGDLPTTYSLNIRSVTTNTLTRPPTENQQGGLPKFGNGGYRKSVSQETVEQQTDIHFRNSKAKSQKKGNEAPTHTAIASVSPDRTGSVPATPQSHRARAGESQQPQPSRTGSLRTLGDILATRQPPLPQTVPTVPTAPEAPLRELAPTPQIMAAVEAISAEFADTAHLKSNLSQATNIWQACGKSEAAIVSSLYEARSITKHQRNVRRPMPYFWSMVRDLVGLKVRDHEHNAHNAEPTTLAAPTVDG